MTCDLCGKTLMGCKCTPVTYKNAEIKKKDAEIKKLKARIVELETVLGMSEPWPLVDVLARLLDLAEHAQTAHSCDRHGYEEDLEARTRGYAILKRLRERIGS